MKDDKDTITLPPRPHRFDKTDLHAAVEALRRGGVIAYPTDTIWGIGCDATNEEAVARVKEVKGSNDAKALITLVPDIGMLERWVDNIPPVALELVEASEGARPVTIVYDSPATALARGLLAPDGSAGIRVCADPFVAAICRALRRPIVSTSANFSGSPSPASFADIDPALLARLDYVATYRRGEPRSSRRASSVIKISAGGLFKILRP